MHTRHCLKIADRIHTLLLGELGQGLDRQRMLAEPRYARDVLLVCEALRQTDGPFLAHHYRRAVARPDEAAAAPQPAAAGFRAPRWLQSLFGPADQAPLLKRSSSPPSATWSPTP